MQQKDTPGPTAYDVVNAYSSLVKGKKEAPRTKQAQLRQESFNVASRRDFKLAQGEEVPGFIFIKCFFKRILIKFYIRAWCL